MAMLFLNQRLPWKRLKWQSETETGNTLSCLHLGQAFGTLQPLFSLIAFFAPKLNHNRIPTSGVFLRIRNVA